MAEAKDIVVTFAVNIPKALQGIADEICDKYCKYPDTWDEEKEGCALCDSEICKNCPLSLLT